MRHARRGPGPACRRLVVLAAVLALSGAGALEAQSLPPAAPTPDPSPAPQARLLPVVPGRMALPSFATSPFPFRGNNPETGKPFLDVVQDGRRGHTAPRAGGILWEDQTYADRRVLLFIPQDFDIKRPAAIVLYLHGNEMTLERDVAARQDVPGQIVRSKLNAVLVAPQFASDALDSSAGHFWDRGALRRFLGEAARQLAKLDGEPSSAGKFASMPVVVVAYSGGYLPMAYALQWGDADRRLRGIVLLDALFGEDKKFLAWLARRHGSAFFVSAYSQSSHDGNIDFQKSLAAHGIGYGLRLPEHLRSGSVVFVDAGQVDHTDFVTRAWTADPLVDVLSRIETARTPPAKRISASR